MLPIRPIGKSETWKKKVQSYSRNTLKHEIHLKF